MTATTDQMVLLHGRQLAYAVHRARGPQADRCALPLVMVHGVGSSSMTWDPVAVRLAAAGVAVVTVDLPGHGRSAKGRGDYSLGALACVLRDLLDHLGIATCILVGHSLGGGIAMQFSYQFPDRVSGLVLVASGGLGPEASPLLRAATLPGAELVLPLVAHPRSVRVLAAVSRIAGFLRVGPPLLDEASLTILADLADPAARAAFLATLRSVVDVSGQRVSAVSKLPAAGHLPILLVWGDRDPIIPIAHGRAAVKLLPHGRLVIFPGAGHKPHRHDPVRFADLLREHAAQVEAGTATGAGGAVAGAAPGSAGQVGSARARTSDAARSPVRRAPSMNPDQAPAVHSPASTTRANTRAPRSGSVGSPVVQAPATG